MCKPRWWLCVISCSKVLRPTWCALLMGLTWRRWGRARRASFALRGGCVEKIFGRRCKSGDGNLAIRACVLKRDNRCEGTHFLEHKKASLLMQNYDDLVADALTRVKEIM